MKTVITLFALVLSTQTAFAATAKCDIIEKMGEESTTNHQLDIELDAENSGEGSVGADINVQIYFPNTEGELGEINVTTPFVSGRANNSQIVVTDGYQSVSVNCALMP